MIKSFSLSVFILLVAALLESAILSNIAILPAIPDLSLICVLYFSLHNGKLIGESTGFVSGLFLDFLSGAPFGLNCLLRTLIGYIGGLFSRTVNSDGFFIAILLGILGTISKGLILFVLSFLFPAGVIRYNLFSWFFLFQLCANAILTPFVFKFLSIFNKTLILQVEAAS
ncbi:MAG: rod shape-determining protein MreD [Treponema sp.]|nr:rod shape-determining protein MreD [Treponema sp.]